MKESLTWGSAVGGTWQMSPLGPHKAAQAGPCYLLGMMDLRCQLYLRKRFQNLLHKVLTYTILRLPKEWGKSDRHYSLQGANHNASHLGQEGQEVQSQSLQAHNNGPSIAICYKQRGSLRSQVVLPGILMWEDED